MVWGKSTPLAISDNENILQIKSPYADLKAKVVPTPFFDPNKDIPRGALV